MFSLIVNHPCGYVAVMAPVIFFTLYALAHPYDWVEVQSFVNGVVRTAAICEFYTPRITFD